jgi:hypothetical protein
MSPEPVRFDRNIASGTPPGAFKHSVFDKVTDSVEFSCFVARTAAYPDPGRHRTEPGHVFSQDNDPVREFG